jgi:hypothetical protein
MSDGYWRPKARAAIELAHATVPLGASFKERMAIIDAAYPFDVRQYHPYKIWLAERRKYMAMHDGRPNPERLPMSPLDRAKAAYERAAKVGQP